MFLYLFTDVSVFGEVAGLGWVLSGAAGWFLLRHRFGIGVGKRRHCEEADAEKRELRELHFGVDWRRQSV